jgi:hypothetical protein
LSRWWRSHCISSGRTNCQSHIARAMIGSIQYCRLVRNEKK